MSMNWLKNKKTSILQSALVKNSAWGIASNILQTIFVSLFFVIVAREYTPTAFAQFLISNTVYQIIVAFSSMGLGQWFIRQYDQEPDKVGFTSKFLKTQIGLGILFYLINILIAYILYPEGQIRLLCIILGTNIIFDNFINAIKSLNIAEERQKKTASILIIDGFLKFLVGCLLFIIPFSPVVLSMLMIVVRLFTSSIFINLGTANSISLKLLWKAKISYTDLKELILKNWQFIVIGSISIIYWKVANIIISKFLTLTDVANYEIANRIFTILGILPVIASATIYPKFIKHFNSSDFEGLKSFYKNLYLIYTLFALVSYAFIISFSTQALPIAFGNGYPGADICLKQMFLTFLLLPTVLLQANLIVAIGLERKDMWFNILSFIINVAGCFIGLYFYKTLAVINYSIFLSFIFFHIAQDVLLISKKLTSIKSCIIYYSGLFVFLAYCHYFSNWLNQYIFFIVTSFGAITAALLIKFLQGGKHIGMNQFSSVTGK